MDLQTEIPTAPDSEVDASVYEGCQRLKEASDLFRDVCRKITNRHVTASEVMVMPLERIPAYVTLFNAVISAENLKTAIEAAFADEDA